MDRRRSTKGYRDPVHNAGLSIVLLWADLALRSGIRSRRETTAVEALLNALDVFSLDPPAARRASEVRRALESKGQTIGMADSLIAGICLERDGILLTRNVKHFSRVDGLTLSGQY